MTEHEKKVEKFSALAVQLVHELESHESKESEAFVVTEEGFRQTLSKLQLHHEEILRRLQKATESVIQEVANAALQNTITVSDHVLNLLSINSRRL